MNPIAAYEELNKLILIDRTIGWVHDGMRCPFNSVHSQLPEEARKRIPWELFLSTSQRLHGGATWLASAGGMTSEHMVRTWISLGVLPIVFTIAKASSGPIFMIDQSGFKYVNPDLFIPDGCEYVVLVQQGNSHGSLANYNPVTFHRASTTIKDIIAVLGQCCGDVLIKLIGLEDLKFYRHMSRSVDDLQRDQIEPVLYTAPARRNKRGGKRWK